MRIGVVHTVGSPCRCAEAVSAGLGELKHEAFIVDSNEIEIHAPALVEACDLVIDHTDTYCGRGLYRPIVRLLLEDFGARIVGSSSKACFTADNKAAAKILLSKAGLAVPQGIVIHSDAWTLPKWLRPPLVLKPAFEHMSRGVSVVQTEREARTAAAQLLELLHQPLLLESYIPGRELAVSVIDGTHGFQVLPIAEWKIDRHAAPILTEDFKLAEASLDERHQIVNADLPRALQQEIEDSAGQAFHALDLRDYARFDLRLSPDGCLFFLEANTTPSLEPMEALALSAQWTGLTYAALIERLLSAAQQRHKTTGPPEKRIVHIQLSTGTAELEIADGVHFPPQSTTELAGLLDAGPGEYALELGCGCGLLSIAMASLGAKRVVATDLDTRALENTWQNACRNGVENRIEIRAGSWYEALLDGALEAGDSRFDLIVATPPQTPGRRPFGPKYGGADGTRHLSKIIRGAPRFLKPEGRLWLLAVSLANPAEVFNRLRESFSDVALVRETERPFDAAEYEELQEGLFEYLRELRASGVSKFSENREGRCAFSNLFIRAAKPRKI